MSALPKTLRYTTVFLPPRWYKIITRLHSPTKTFVQNGRPAWWLDDWTIVKIDEGARD